MEYLSSKEITLQTIALKYLIYFEEADSTPIQTKLKELSDSDDGDVASQCFLDLGILKLKNILVTNDASSIIEDLVKCRNFFEASAQSVENRVDAIFFKTFIEVILSIFNDDFEHSKKLSGDLERLLQEQTIYELSFENLDFQLLILKRTQDLLAVINHSLEANEWIELSSEFSVLLNLRLNLNIILETGLQNSKLVNTLSGNIFRSIEELTYRKNISSSAKRLNRLEQRSDDIPLKEFIRYLLTLMPSVDEKIEPNLSLLTVLAEHFGASEAQKFHQEILEKKDGVALLSKLLKDEKKSTGPFRTGSIYGEEIFNTLLNSVKKILETYPAEKRDIFERVLEEIIRYVRNTAVGSDKSKYSFLYSSKEKGKGKKAVEADLQESMMAFFQHSSIADGLDHEKARFFDGGRVDILYKRDIITIPIELKRSMSLPNIKSIETDYIAQAQTYTAGYDQLGIFVVMELSAKDKIPPANFKDWFYVHHLKPASKMPIQHPDLIISVIIPGNKTTPSAKSKYA
ncbi:MAG: hypothetical protein EOO20_02780 [Chryseobacterium sp.]|nr:MAG: hypothetical protein EOO20_02780 [Chryseobacterium sp.]